MNEKYDKAAHLAQVRQTRDYLQALSSAGALDADGWDELQFFRAEAYRLGSELDGDGSVPVPPLAAQPRARSPGTRK